MRHFGRTYALFRGEDGAAGVIDDICPHLGAHLAVGGCVRGNSVRARILTGRSTATASAPRSRTAAHAVHERHGMIFMYRNHEGTGPTHPLPEIEDFDPAEYTAHATGRG